MALLYLFLTGSLVFGLLWHNGSLRSERERESDNRDPAVLFSRQSFRSQQGREDHVRE
jgi:hypothetical protein